MVIPNSSDPSKSQQSAPSQQELLRELPSIDLRLLIERRFHRGYYCPRCGSQRYHGHGQYRRRRRFRCVECGRTFNELTGTPMHGTRYPGKWLAYICCMFWGLSLRRTAALIGISLPTAFTWRHKLLIALRDGAAIPELEGIMEMDELYVLHSEKGNRHLDRPPRKRGTGHAMSRGRAHRDRACVLAVHDRREGHHLVVTGMGQPTVFDVEQALPSTRFRATTLCVDRRQAYWSYSRRHTIPRILFPIPWRRHGLYHMRRVDTMLTRFEQWMTRFNGVATKYLPNYAHWFQQLYEAQRWNGGHEAVSKLWLLRSFDAPLSLTRRRSAAA